MRVIANQAIYLVSKPQGGFKVSCREIAGLLGLGFDHLPVSRQYLLFSIMSQVVLIKQLKRAFPGAAAVSHFLMASLVSIDGRILQLPANFP
jgi:hypothetical protein